jgi:hypothetical protein
VNFGNTDVIGGFNAGITRTDEARITLSAHKKDEEHQEEITGEIYLPQ